jgi:hypothetical protein
MEKNNVPCQACGKTPEAQMACSLCIWSLGVETCFCDEDCFRKDYGKYHKKDCLQAAIDKILVSGIDGSLSKSEKSLLYLMNRLKSIVVNKKPAYDLTQVVLAFILVLKSLLSYFEEKNNLLKLKDAMYLIAIIQKNTDEMIESLKEEDISMFAFFALMEQQVTNNYIEASLWLASASSRDFINAYENLDAAEEIFRDCFKTIKA